MLAPHWRAVVAESPGTRESSRSRRAPSLPKRKAAASAAAVTAPAAIAAVRTSRLSERNGALARSSTARASTS